MKALQGPVAVLGRLLLCTIFFMAAVGNKIPHFNDVAALMEKVGVPFPQIALIGAITFLIAGSVSIVLGFQARLGALLLLVFLVLATYYFHPFWKVPEEDKQKTMVDFMKNLSMMGAMLYILAVGSGPWSLDGIFHKSKADVSQPKSA